jgi:hypothetical protein
LPELRPRLATPHLPNGLSADAEHLGESVGTQTGSADQLGVGVRQLGSPSTPTVLGARHGFKMVGAKAGRDPAQMIDLVARRDRPDELLVRGSMDKPGLAGQGDPAVASLGLRLEHADPAWGAVPAILFTPKVGCDLRSHSQRDHMPTDEADGMTAKVAKSPIGLAGERGWLATTALADPTWVWWLGQWQHPDNVTKAKDGESCRSL